MTYDLIIIGGGPAGAAAAVYAARKKMKAALIADSFGGQSVVSADIQNWVGVKSISGLDFAKALEDHVRSQEGLEVKDGKVKKVEELADGLAVSLEDGSRLETKTLLLATGSRHRRLGIPGEDEFDGKGVVYCSICDAPLFGGKEVAVVGGGNSGLEAVLDVAPYATKIYLLHRHPELKGDSVTQEKVRAVPQAEILLSTAPTEISGDSFVKKLKYRELGSGAEKELAVEGVFVEIGNVPNSDLVSGLADIEEHGAVVVDPRTQRTSHKRIWAAGDVCDGLYRQNNISMGDAVKALLNIQEFLRGRETK